ncbi:MAG: exosome complex component [Candidatus Xenobia bacterium]
MKKLIATGALVLALGLLPVAAHAANYTYASQIYSVTHTGAARQASGASWIKTGDTVEVIATGTPGAKVTFDVGPNAEGYAMSEVSPGKYEGKFKLEPRHFIHQQVWIVVHSTQEGQKTTAYDPTPLVLAP